MLDYTIELISLAASNSLVVFCFCNLIIAILLIGSSAKSDDEMKPDNAFSNTANHENLEKTTFSAFEKANHNNNNNNDDVVIETVEEKASSVSIDMVDCEENEEEDNDDDEDELKKRAEEFIEKINRGWRAEKMKSLYSLGQ